MVRALTRTYRLYHLHELSGEARARALDRCRFFNVEGDWHAPVVAEWTERLAGFGYNGVRIFFSGFSSQGDGACFEARVDLNVCLSSAADQARYPAIPRAYEAGDLEVSLRHSGRYYHEYSVRVAAEYRGGDDAVLRALDDLERLIEDDARARAREIYRALQTEYDYLVSDAAVAEALEANGFEFHSDGRVFAC